MKTLILNERQQNILKDKPSAMDQVGNKARLGVINYMAENEGNIIKMYRGYNSEFGSQKDHLLWLTSDIDYAKGYGDEVEEYQIDITKCRGSISLMPDYVDYIDGPDEETCEELLADGYNSYWFDANDDQSECLCLWSDEPIVGKRILSQDEFDNIEGYIEEDASAESDTYEITGNGDLEYNHVIEEGIDDYIWETSEGWGTPDSYSFVYQGKAYYGNYDSFKSKPYAFCMMNGDEFRISDMRGTHEDLYEEQDTDEDYMGWPGRLFLGDNVIVFWGEERNFADGEIPDRHMMSIICDKLANYFSGEWNPDEAFFLRKSSNDADTVQFCKLKDYLHPNKVSKDIIGKKQNANDWNEAERNGIKKMNDMNSIYNDKMYNRFLPEETNPNSVDLSSFELQDKLHTQFWKDEDTLDSKVRLQLLDIADDFMETLDIPWAKPKDITMTGSLANYNWSKKYSDVDIHIMMDYKDVDDRKEFVKHYCDSKKNEWNQNHENLTIYGFPVEVYVQDINEPAVQGGTYSLNKNKWVTKPDKKEMSDKDLDKAYIRKRVAEFMDRVDELEDNFKNCGEDDYKSRKLSDKANALCDEIYALRNRSLEKAGKEMTNGNIIFKALRRFGYIEKLFDLTDKSYDKEMSLNEHTIRGGFSWTDPFNFSNEVLNNPLMEGYYSTFPIEKTLDWLNEKYRDRVSFTLIDAENGEKEIIAQFYNTDDNQKILDKDLSLCGYYAGYVDEEGDTRIVQYEPRHQNKVNETVYNRNYLYHLTPTNKVDKILSNGLSPRSSELTTFNYDGRIYLFLDMPNERIINLFTEQRYREKMKKYYIERDKNHNYDMEYPTREEYTLLQIDTKLIDNDFFYDPNADGCVYTKENISPQAINRL